MDCTFCLYSFSIFGQSFLPSLPQLFSVSCFLVLLLIGSVFKVFFCDSTVVSGVVQHLLDSQIEQHTHTYTNVRAFITPVVWNSPTYTQNTF